MGASVIIKESDTTDSRWPLVAFSPKGSRTVPLSPRNGEAMAGNSGSGLLSTPEQDLLVVQAAHWVRNT